MAGPLYLAWKSQHGVGKLASPKRGPTIHHPQARKMKGRLRSMGYKGVKESKVMWGIISESARNTEARHSSRIGKDPSLGQRGAMVTNRMKGMARSVRHGVVNQRNVWTKIKKG